jgi:hypothetical protein
MTPGKVRESLTPGMCVCAFMCAVYSCVCVLECVPTRPCAVHGGTNGCKEGGGREGETDRGWEELGKGLRGERASDDTHKDVPTQCL